MAASCKQLLFQTLLLFISWRLINTKTPGPSPEGPDPFSPLPTDVRSVVLKGKSHTEKVELSNAVSLALECVWTGSQNKQPNITASWRKDDHELETITVPLENGQYNLKRVFNIVAEENLGIYSCVYGGEAKIDFVLAAPRIADLRDKPIVSYVRDSVVIACKVEESKAKPSTWKWYKANGTEKEQISAAAEPLRYEIKNKEWKTQLVVHNLTEADAGLYYCGAVYPVGTAMGHVELKVITFLEPLKPFIAIVVEVVILVAAILLYERSQSRRKKAAGDEMTDQSNTLTSGENLGSEGTSSTRQRKV